MSDIAPTKAYPLTLPEELIFDIFLKSDPKTLVACRATNHYWRDKLNAIPFLQETHSKWKARGQFIYLHFTLGPFNQRPDWIMKMDATTGEAMQLALPVTINPGGWFRIIGTANGNVCMRFSSTGKAPQILIWNPAANTLRSIRDPTQHFCTMCTFTYAFLYYPGSSKYAIVHIFKRNLGDQDSWLTMFCAESSDWQYVIPCPKYVKNLDQNCVTSDGVAFWLSWSMHDSTYPSYIVSFSIANKSFFTIPIPHHIVSHDHRLLIYQDSLCMVSNRDTRDGYEINMFRILKNGIHYAWEKIFTFTGIGSLENPVLIHEEELILLKKTHRERNALMRRPETSQFMFLRFDPLSQHKKILNAPFYLGHVQLISTHVYSQGCFPV
ncbi:hypothetical protein HN51_045464 [Arachis hypogaea]